MTVPEQELVAINQLPAEARYTYAVKKIVDAEEAWGLYSEGWALAAGNGEKQIFPIWPAREFAKLCAEGDWSGYVPAEIQLEDLLQELLPMLDRQGIHMAVAFLPDENGVVVDPGRFAADLEEESLQYE